jgi:hypothetical protein
MTNEFLFQITNEAGGSLCKCCQMPAEFLAGYPAVGLEPFCATCIAPYVMQSLKCKGVNLRSIEDGFLKLSAAFDAPPESLLLQ